jgi:hypothetical protein
MKTIILFGTKHYRAVGAPLGIREIIEYLINEADSDVDCEVILEEWSDTAPQSLANAVANDRGLPWENIGTPDLPEFKTYPPDPALGVPYGTANIRRHGPIDVQEKREAAMCENIRVAMSACETALIVIGMAHLQSMCVRLAGVFNVQAYGFTGDFF